jgi:hypothetical protein
MSSAGLTASFPFDTLMLWWFLYLCCLLYGNNDILALLRRPLQGTKYPEFGSSVQTHSHAQAIRAGTHDQSWVLKLQAQSLCAKLAQI